MKFLVMNGPNINLLGIREPELYGKETYQALLDRVRAACGAEGIEVEFFQSNHEGALVDRIQEAYFEKVDGIVINPAAYTHTSVALLDAVKAVKIPAVEVHISQVSERSSGRFPTSGRPASKPSRDRAWKATVRRCDSSNSFCCKRSSLRRTLYRQGPQGALNFLRLRRMPHSS